MSIHTTPRTDRAEIIRAVKAITAIGRGGITELRALFATANGTRRIGTYSGYFNDAEKLADAVESLTSASGIYIIPNDVNLRLIFRRKNNIRLILDPKQQPSTTDKDITARHFLLIDCDAIRESGISATDAEHEAALARARMIHADLSEAGWPDGIYADSGNGGHLVYLIVGVGTLEDDDLIRRCLESLQADYGDECIKIDTGVYNPSRIWKLPGTLACKGDNTEECPHRMARIITQPDDFGSVKVTREQLEALAARAPKPAQPQPAQPNAAPFQSDGARTGGFDFEGFIARNWPDAKGPKPWHDGQLWELPVCPWDETHINSAVITRGGNGKYGFRCLHDSCQGKDWHALRDKFEPRRLNPVNPRESGGNVSVNNRKRSIPTLPAAADFPIDLLSPAVARFVHEATEAIGCNSSFIALPIIACLARAIGNSRVIRLKPTWHEPAIIWGAIVGKSGWHKSPALSTATAILNRKQAESVAQFKHDSQHYEQERALYDRDYQQWKRLRSTEPPPWEPKPPHCNRFIVSDITIEALAERLNNQFDGVLLIRDELAGWINGIAEYKHGKGSDCGHWLAAWSGAPMTLDRKSGAEKMFHVPRANVSIIGGIQPPILKTAIGREHMQDGLCARLLLTFPEPRPVRWNEAVIAPEVAALIGQVFNQLIAIEPAADAEGKPEPYPLPLTQAAKLLWIDYYNRHRAEQIELDDDLAAAWSKLEAYAARLALIIHLCRWAEGLADADAIDETSIAAGIGLSDWFGGEAKRVYGVLAESDEDRRRRELVELIRRKGGSITTRELMRCRWGYSTAEDAEADLDALVKAGLGVWEPMPVGDRGGKPTRVFKLT